MMQHADHGKVYRESGGTGWRIYPHVKPQRPSTLRHWGAWLDPRTKYITMRGQRAPRDEHRDDYRCEWIEYVPEVKAEPNLMRTWGLS